MSRLVKRSAIRAFEVFGSLAVLLNIFAAVVAIKRDLWTMALAYFFIAAVLASALAVHWYVVHRQVPYRWRDEGWGLERWREGRHDPEGADEDVDEERYWSDDFDDRDRD